jgi:coenzyme F420-dependent glucose-6-phosphate dehydrogenase
MDGYPEGSKMEIAYHASHEQFPPGQLLELAVRAQAAGFDGVGSSDHFHPWSDRQGHSGFAWSWLGAALQATKLPFGVVTAPGQRYHPAVLAQAVATLGEMFPGRLTVALGTGQLLNEGITGKRWPTKADRNRRLVECADIMRALWAGETVSYRGPVTVEKAKLYSPPAEPPLLIGAAISAETAEWCGGWADGLITISKPPEELRRVVEAFRAGGGKTKPMHLKVQLSYAADDEAAAQGAWDQWRTNVFDSPVLSDLRTPAQFDAAAEFVRLDDLDRFVRISSDPQRHVGWLKEDARMGFNRLYLHNVNKEQSRFIDDFGREVIPALRAGGA